MRQVQHVPSLRYHLAVLMHYQNIHMYIHQTVVVEQCVSSQAPLHSINSASFCSFGAAECNTVRCYVLLSLPSPLRRVGIIHDAPSCISLIGALKICEKCIKNQTEPLVKGKMLFILGIFCYLQLSLTSTGNSDSIWVCGHSSWWP